ncbi:hypothetical protein BAUCODRAFT_133984 [Baudoinia panamericana UAMH 10762]|uniref:NADP-dependent oxidoreductase domain-containing protein n=1 Tax=Baudoinia panamericana (strain UAMH 10762) TaxID=717646 RepID=M2N0D6_BAUPA|nr:uncharacterized protein BAUCODRAFT_133984 [Baudoinia panamericana UAMH 10762]EMC92040.1 hypothetical protein BAUCODRAFT_133984 [Baudoinia panamericana UAMH 10762]
MRPTLKAAGLNRTDTAARYVNGESERRIGEAELAKDFILDTKILYERDGSGTLTAEAIEKSLCNSFRVMRTEKVNPLEETAKAMNEQYQKGRFTLLGLSNFMVERVQTWLDIASKNNYIKPTVYEGHYYLLCRTHEDTLLPLLRQNGMVYNAYSPLAGGFLLGNCTEDGLQGGTRYSNPASPYVKWYSTPAMHAAMKQLRAISETTSLAMDDLSLRWLKYHSALGNEHGIILGASKPEHVERGTALLGKGPLEESVVRELNALWNEPTVKEDADKVVDFTQKERS